MQRTILPVLAVLTVAAAALALAPAAEAQPRDHSVRFRAGLFTPEGDSDYWEDSEILFSDSVDDFEDISVGFDYQYSITPRLALMLSVSGYNAESDRDYREFVDQDGFPIRSTAELDLTTLTGGLVLHLAPTHAPIQPYIGAGGGLYSYELIESGDFIDFFFEPPEIFRDTFIAEGDVLGYYLVGGLEIPVGTSFSLFAEGRWHRAEDELGDDFEGFGDLDLSGREVSGGFAWRF